MLDSVEPRPQSATGDPRQASDENLTGRTVGSAVTGRHLDIAGSPAALLRQVDDGSQRQRQITRSQKQNPV